MSKKFNKRQRERCSPKFVTFGKHLTIDGYGCNEKNLNSMGLIFDLLEKLPGKIAMHALGAPYVIRCLPNNKKDCGGISGFVIIAESHIAIHTFPAKQYLTMDVYSCSMFNENAVLAYVKELFGYNKLEKHIIKRGLSFPKENILE